MARGIYQDKMDLESPTSGSSTPTPTCTRGGAAHDSPSQLWSPAQGPTTPTEEEPTRFARGWRFYASWGCLCLVTFVTAVDATIISVAIPTIAEEINAGAMEAFWMGTSFLLASTVFQPVFSAFSHIFGRRNVLLAALALFTVGSAMCALARNVALMLAGRAVQGTGAGGLMALTYVIVTDLVSLRERGKWFSLISLTYAVGSVSGPVIGGALAERSWTWIFWLNLPFCALAFVAIPLVLTLRQSEGSISEKLRGFDWMGALIFVGALTSILVPLTWGGISYDWDAYQTLAPLLVGLGGLVAFAVHITRLAPRLNVDPLIRPSLFKTMTGLAAYFGTVLQGIVVWGVLFYCPLYSEVVLGQSPTMAGVFLFPFTATVAPAAAAVGIGITRTGRYRPSLWVGWALAALGFGLMGLLGRHTRTAEWILIYLVGGAGLGVLYSALSLAAQASASNSDLPFAAGMYAFCRSLGQCLGVAVGGAVFQNSFKAQIAKNPNPALSAQAAAWAKEASALVQAVHRLRPDQQPARDAIVDGFVLALRSVWLLLTILTAVGLVTALLFVKHKGIDRVFEAEQGLVDNRSRKLGLDVERAAAAASYGLGQKEYDTASPGDSPFDTPQRRWPSLSVASVPGPGHRSVSDAAPTLGPLEFEFSFGRATITRPSTAHASAPPPSRRPSQRLNEHQSALRGAISGPPTEFHRPLPRSASAYRPHAHGSGGAGGDDFFPGIRKAGTWPAPLGTGVRRPSQGTSS